MHEFYNAAFKDGPSPSTTVGETEGGGPGKSKKFTFFRFLPINE